MRRIIKFRGKDIQTGEWVYGFYSQGSCIDPISGEERVRHIIRGDVLYDVDPETVGQFTGTWDLNGEEVYEGDIVMHDGNHELGLRIVAFYDQTFGIFTKDEYNDIRKGQNPWLNDYARPTCMNEWSVDDLLKVVGNIYDEDIVPELKESKDERIRKQLIAVVELYYGETDEQEKKDCLSWLEKQGEVKDSAISQHDNKTCKENDDSLTREDERIRKALSAYFDKFKPNDMWDEVISFGDIVAWLRKKGEHKPCMIKWKGDNLKEVIDFTGKSKNFDKWFKSFEEYEKYVGDHNGIFKIFNTDGSHYEIPVGAWIVKTPDGYNVASKAILIQNSAWSEEDEKMLNSFLHKLEVCDLLSNKENVWAVRKLKSLKDRYAWKPIKEQIISLRWVLSHIPYNSHKEEISGLLEQLKKLMEE